MNVTALITGRGNNTFKDKNVANVLGKPLMSYPCIEARKCKDITDFYVSSNDDKILNVGNQYGFTSIKRPPELSLPSSQHVDVIMHALSFIRQKHNVDILIVLMANNATIKSEWIEKSINMIKNDDTISSVCPVERDQDHHPFRAKTISSSGNLIPFFDFSGCSISTNRQDLSPCFFLCHNFWALNVKNSLLDLANGQQPWTFLGNNIKMIETTGCFDVHNEYDLHKTEDWIKDNILN